MQLTHVTMRSHQSTNAMSFICLATSGIRIIMTRMPLDLRFSLVAYKTIISDTVKRQVL